MTLYTYGATPSTIGDRYNRHFDAELSLRDYTATAATGDTNGSTVEFYAEKYESYKFVINHAAIGGTVDGSNLWTVKIEADNENTFTSPVTLVSQVLTATASEYVFPMTGERAKALRVANSMTTELTYIRVVLDETGTTAGNLTAGAYISVDC